MPGLQEEQQEEDSPRNKDPPTPDRSREQRATSQVAALQAQLAASKAAMEHVQEELAAAKGLLLMVEAHGQAQAQEVDAGLLGQRTQSEKTLALAREEVVQQRRALKEVGEQEDSTRSPLARWPPLPASVAHRRQACERLGPCLLAGTGGRVDQLTAMQLEISVRRSKDKSLGDYKTSRQQLTNQEAAAEQRRAEVEQKQQLVSEAVTALARARKEAAAANQQLTKCEKEVGVCRQAHPLLAVPPPLLTHS